ncbi:MAG TPA: hypothetical protein VJ975_01845 [Candidatus Limnocylindria bacterium]|nr:hypothetical protein [Candidatus Limnocylindria bacterium]
MRTFIAALLVLLVLAACTASSGPDTPVDDDDSPPATSGPGPAVLVVAEGNQGGDTGMSVSEALGHRATDDLVVVSGALFVNADGAVLLCEAIAESFPPQCGGARLEVHGLDLSSIDALQREGDVRWAESAVLFGSVE